VIQGSEIIKIERIELIEIEIEIEIEAYDQE